MSKNKVGISFCKNENYLLNQWILNLIPIIMNNYSINKNNKIKIRTKIIGCTKANIKINLNNHFHNYLLKINNKIVEKWLFWKIIFVLLIDYKKKKKFSLDKTIKRIIKIIKMIKLKNKWLIWITEIKIKNNSNHPNNLNNLNKFQF